MACLTDTGGVGAGSAGDGAHDVAHGVEAGGHGSVSAHDGGAATFHFPLFPPLAVAMFFASIPVSCMGEIS